MDFYDDDDDNLGPDIQDEELDLQSISNWDMDSSEYPDPPNNRNHKIDIKLEMKIIKKFETQKSPWKFVRSADLTALLHENLKTLSTSPASKFIKWTPKTFVDLSFACKCPKQICHGTFKLR